MNSALFVTIGIVAWLTAAATAVRSASRIWLRHWVERRLSGAMTAEIYLERPQRLLLAASTGVSLTVFAAGALIARSGGGPAQVGRSILAYAMVLLVVGQLVPRAVARRWPATLVPVLLPPVQALELFLTPLLAVVRRLTGERADAPVTSNPDGDAIEELLREGAMEGVGAPEEIAIISGVVQFGERTLAEVMTPRTDIFALDATLARDEMAQRIAQSEFSRVPVFETSPDRMVGVVHVFDLLKGGPGDPIRVRPVATAAATVGCNECLFRMLRERKHLTVVTDASGRTVGIVTLEDLLEELVGDIRDEHDDPGAPTGPPPRPA